MKQSGYVTEVKEKTLMVRVDRESACGGNCVSCKGCGSEAVIVECEKADNINVGDMVTIVMEEKSFFKNVFLGYGLAIILMIVGAAAGYTVFKNEISSVMGTVIGLITSLVIQKILFARQKTELKIVKRMDR